MRNWLIPATGIVVAFVAIAGVTFAVAGSPFDSGEQPAVRSDQGIDRQECSPVDNTEACDETNGNGDNKIVVPVCAIDVPDCGEMIVSPGGDSGGDPDQPVSSGPISIIDDMDPNECSLVHNIEACREQATAAAVRDLAKNTGAQPDAVAVMSAEFVEWPNACLGVYNPKIACAEVITPGFKVTLQVDSVTYEYRTNADGSSVIGGK